MTDASPREPNLLDQAVRKAGRPLGYAFLFSFASNILYLALPIYMIQLYGRVLGSQSVATLIILSLTVLGCFLLQAVVDDYRSKILIQFGVVFDRMLSHHLFRAVFQREAAHGTGQTQAIRDLDQFRQILTGSGMAVVFDLPWAPIFMLALFVIDPWIGLICLIGGFVLLGLAFLQDRMSRNALTAVNDAANRGYQFLDMAVRNAEVARALGMMPALNQRWSIDRRVLIEGQAHASETAGSIGDVIKFVRMFIQVLVLAGGCFLVLKQVIGPGVLFANMMLSAKALAPFERVVGSWQYLVDAQAAYKRLHKLFAGYEPAPKATSLPRPNGLLEIAGMSFGPPGAAEPILKNLSFALQPGESLGIIGPSGAGKSTLSRLLIGVWKPTDGAVRLDGADISAWERTAFGRHVGYLPQDMEIFSGTVRDNIARFRTDVPDADIHTAAIEAGVHEIVMRLPKQYDTELGATGHLLSVGQRQRLGLARALLGNPALVILDEPNANLDTEGEQVLLNALAVLKARRCTVVIVSHRASVFRHVDKILYLFAGGIKSFGDRETVLAEMMQPVPAQPQAPQPVASTAGQQAVPQRAEGNS